MSTENVLMVGKADDSGSKQVETTPKGGENGQGGPWFESTGFAASWWEAQNSEEGSPKAPPSYARIEDRQTQGHQAVQAQAQVQVTTAARSERQNVESNLAFLPQPGTELGHLSLNQLSQEDVIMVLRQLKLGRYIPQFRQARVDGAILAALTDEDMEELGVNLKAHRRRLLMELSRFKETGVPLVASVNVTVSM